jgi:hypothetical protein
VRYIASAIRFEDRAPGDAVRPPLLGEHTLRVLSEWLDLDPAATQLFIFQVAAIAVSREAVIHSPPLTDRAVPIGTTVVHKSADMPIVISRAIRYPRSV